MVILPRTGGCARSAQQRSYKRIFEKMQDRMPLGVIIKYALKDVAEYHGKVHKKQQAWEDKKRENQDAQREL